MANLKEWNNYFREMEEDKLRNSIDALNSLAEDAPKIEEEFEGLDQVRIIAQIILTERESEIGRRNQIKA